jgi:hypothetical protein
MRLLTNNQKSNQGQKNKAANAKKRGGLTQRPIQKKRRFPTLALPSSGSQGSVTDTATLSAWLNQAPLRASVLFGF